METTNIYILIDPETQQVRYVGKANNISQRYKAHLNRARKHQIHKLNWINSLKTKELKPIIEIIDVVPIKDWIFWETYWISQFKTWGFDLINYTQGGDGATFANQTSFKKRHKPWNYGTAKPKILKGNAGKNENSIKHQFKKGVKPWNYNVTGYTTSKKGKSLSEDQKQKISNSLKGKPSNKKRTIKQFDMDKNLIRDFASITEAKEITGIKGINNALTGRAKTAGGYIWA
jgi:hypothetical protein